jgi:cyclophilin family peptidyl-prolyl cis-trans isomerase
MLPIVKLIRLPILLAAVALSQPAMAQAPAAAPDAAAPATPTVAEPENILHLDLSSGGRVSIALYADVAPKHVERIKILARRGFYNGIVFHRVIEGFMAQTGDPKGTGEGESDLPDLKAEFNPTPHLRGTVSMARTEEPDSANSQFFIVFLPRLGLDNKYTVFGRVTSGMQFVDAIQKGEPPANPDRILQASIGSDNKPAPNFAGAASVAPAPRPEISVDDLNGN